MILKETTLEDLNRISGKIKHPNVTEDYQYCVKAYSLKIREDYTSSVDLYKKALKINKENIEALKGISECYQSMGNYPLAIKYYNNIKLLKPFDKTVHYELGCLEYDNKNYVQSIKHFINAIKLAPEYYDAIYALGQAHEAIQEYEMAEMIYLKIINNRPSYLLAYNRLANMYLKINDNEKAIKYFKQILGVNPDFHRAYLGLGIAYENENQPVKAKKYYKKYLEIKPFSAEREFIMEKLNKLRTDKTDKLKDCNYLALVK